MSHRKSPKTNPRLTKSAAMKHYLKKRILKQKSVIASLEKGKKRKHDRKVLDTAENTVHDPHTESRLRQILLSIYHKYGLKHALLIGAFMLYVCFGALIFVIIEKPAEIEQAKKWENEVNTLRQNQVKLVMGTLFNNSRYLLFLKPGKTKRIQNDLSRSFTNYEKLYIGMEERVGVRPIHRKMQWDYWNAVLFTGSVATTIGYGHIYPRTDVGRFLTMLYALGGLPLVLVLLQDTGGLLTVVLKYPWFQVKRGLRRALRYCTKQSMSEIERIETDERADIHVFDLPIPVAVAIVILWILLCSLLFTWWNPHWTMIKSFYFFFISLSTIGLGDIVPEEPKLLLAMFGLIIIGMSLVSMVISLMQMQLARTYEAGREHLQSSNDTADHFVCLLGWD